MAYKKTRRKSKSKPRYSMNESDLLAFGQWVLFVAFVWLTIAAIITLDDRLMRFSIGLGIILAYGVKKKWFTL